jgi:hypothetical protein
MKSIYVVFLAAALLACACAEQQQPPLLRGGAAPAAAARLPTRALHQLPKEEATSGTVADLPGVFDKRTAIYVNARNNASGNASTDYNKATVSQAALDAYRQAHEKLAMTLSKRWKLTKAEADEIGDPALAGKMRVCVNRE